MEETEININGQNYILQVIKRVSLPSEAPRLVVVAHQPNHLSQKLLQVCIQAIQHFTKIPYELWVIDNNSKINIVNWLQQQEGINIVLNRTEPIPYPELAFLRYLCPYRIQQKWGSFANAIALEIAIRLIDPNSRYLMTLHMDTMPCHPNWLYFLMSRVAEGYGSAGVRMDKIRIDQGTLHVLGNLIDFQLFQKLNLNFFPHLPNYDVGEQITLRLREAGYKVYACHNTLWEPEMINLINPESPLRNFQVDRSFDDQGNIIFLHLGRGVKKTIGKHRSGVSPEDWIRFAEKYLNMDESKSNMLS